MLLPEHQICISIVVKIRKDSAGGIAGERKLKRRSLFHKSSITLIVEEQIFTQTNHDINIVPPVVINVDHRNRWLKHHCNGFKVLRGHHFFIGTVMVTQRPPMFRLSDATTCREIGQCFDQAVTKIFARYLWLINVANQGPISHFIFPLFPRPLDPIRRGVLFPFFALSPDYRMKCDLSHIVVMLLRQKLPLHDL